MDVGAIMIGLVIFLMACSYAVSPFGNQNKKKAVSALVTEKQIGSGDRKGQEEITLNKLRDLDFDYQTGKVSEEDYRPLRSQLVAEAAQAIEAKKLEDAQLEEMLRARRQAKAQKEKCPHCGSSMKPDDQFCPVCGQPAKSTCPTCGKTIHPSDLYCTGCGTPVKEPVEVEG